MEEVVRLALYAITTLRRDADGWVLSPGPPPKRRGARRQDDGKVNGHDVSRFEDLGPRAEEPPLPLYPAVVWHTTLQGRWRRVGLLNRPDPAKPRCIVRGSTDPELHGHTLIDLYAARFQIELLFRASTQFPGLLDCQARAAAACDLHGNAALATLHLGRAEDWGMPQGQEPHVFSMASGKPGPFNARFLDVCMENFALDPTGVKNHAGYETLRAGSSHDLTY
jgi:hypothetical protein